MDTPTTPALVWHQLLASFGILRDRFAQVSLAAAVVQTIIALGVAPHHVPSVGDTVAVMVIGLLVVTAVVSWIASTDVRAAADERQHRQTAAVTLGVSALVFNAILGLSSTVILALMMALVIRQARRLQPDRFPWVLTAGLLTLIPWWVWTAIESWDAGLLMLVPLVGLAWISAEHLRLGQELPGPNEAHLSSKGHRFAAWIAMLGGGALLVLAGMIGHEANAWLALGGIVMVIGVAAEAGAPSQGAMPGRYSIAISNLAFYLAAICWLVSVI